MVAAVNCPAARFLVYMQKGDGDFYHTFVNGARSDEGRLLFYPGEAAYGAKRSPSSAVMAPHSLAFLVVVQAC